MYFWSVSLVYQLSGQFLIFFGRPKKTVQSQGIFVHSLEFFVQPFSKNKKLTGQLVGQETDQNHMDVFNMSWLFCKKLYNSSCISYSILTAGMVHYSELGIFIIIHTALFEKKGAFKRTLKGFKLHQAKNTLLACPSNWSSYEKVYFRGIRSPT